MLFPLWVSAVLAAPGAHGPGGEHLDQAPSAAAGSSIPTVEAKSEAFELVGRLQSGELSILVDRYETNEPVLGAKLEVESGALKATAVFHADHGDYSVTDAGLLDALGTPGEHALVFTLIVGQEGDLLDGTLVTPGEKEQPHDHATDDHVLERAWWSGALILGLGGLGLVGWRLQRRRGAAAGAGALP